MTKKHFIELAQHIMEHNRGKREVWGLNGERMCFNIEQLHTLADFCQAANPRFDRERWIDYINGECGPNGGRPGTHGKPRKGA